MLLIKAGHPVVMISYNGVGTDIDSVNRIQLNQPIQNPLPAVHTIDGIAIVAAQTGTANTKGYTVIIRGKKS